MSKLYPPIITGTLPAFYKGGEIAIPFQMNRAVGYNEVSGFYLKMKTVQNSSFVDVAIPSERYDLKEGIVYFKSDDLPSLNIGQYYKAQIAYENNAEEVGHYSTVGVIKCTSKPQVKIENLELKKDNVHHYSYLGSYAQQGQDKDPSEKLYSYIFNLYDVAGKLLYTSDWQVHDTSQDIEPGKSICEFSLNRELKDNEKYWFEFEVITNNNLHVKSGQYSLIQKKSISPNVDFIVVADSELHLSEGGISIRIKDSEESVKNKILRTGSFKLIRADEETGFNEWNEILAFKLFDQAAPEELFVDYTVKQGIEYRYAIIQYNDYGLQSNKILSKKEIKKVVDNQIKSYYYDEPVKSEFEYIYLFDGERQLKVKYNPKVSSFKEVILESKIDTIGNKYPFIFRNGKVGYKEFPVSGLISTLMDENYLFFGNRKKEPLPKYRVYQHNYKQISVKDEIIYYYQEEYPFLYCRNDKLNDPNNKDNRLYIKVNEYFNYNEEAIRTGFKNDLSFYYRQIFEINEEGKRVEKYKSLKSLGQKMEDRKHYYFDDVKNKLYIHTEKDYIKLPEGSRYDKNTKYYFDYATTKNSNEVSPISFINEYNSNAFQTERDFKLEVLDWLNNGEPKLFRSPTEGNYIIRLMNSSLSPNDQLGRILHNFTSTAYEIAEYNFNNLRNYGFIVTKDLTIKTIRWETVQFDKSGVVQQNSKINLLQYKAVALKFEGMMAGDRIFINDGIKRPGKTEPGYEVVIGSTGSYNLDLNSNMYVTEVYFIESSPDNQEDFDKRTQHQGQLTYAFESAAFSSFDTIESFRIDTVPVHQFYGEYNNIIDEINNIKNQLQQVHFIHAILREELDIYAQYKVDDKGKLVTDEEGNYIITCYTHGRNGKIIFNSSKIEANKLDRYYLYRIFEMDKNQQYKIVKYYDGYSFSELTLTDEQIKYGDKIILNGEYDEDGNIIFNENKGQIIQTFTDNDFFLKETKELKTIYTGYKVLLEICYQTTTTTYGAEKADAKIVYEQVVRKLTEYKIKEALYQSMLDNGEDRRLIYDAQKDMNDTYKDFIRILEKTLKRQEAIEGELVQQQLGLDEL